MESFMHRIINWSGLWELQEKIRRPEDEKECDTGHRLLTAADIEAVKENSPLDYMDF